MTLNIKQWTLAVMASVMLAGCGDFFEESSQDEIKPSTIEDLAAILYSEAYPYSTNCTDDYLVLLTDEVQCNGLNNENYKERMRAGQPVFCFNKQMFDGYESFIDDENSWKNYYKLIMGCNVVLDNVNDMVGKETEKKNIAGQARLLRSFYYLRLAMIYCMPYKDNAETSLGLTLITTSNVKDANPSRSSLKATYDFIENELKASAEELKDYKATTKYRVSKDMADILLSRLYLYEENWDKAIEYANLAISEGPLLTSINDLNGTIYNIYDQEKSSEVVWNYSGRTCRSTYINSYNLYSGKMPYSLSASVKSLYDDTADMRYKKYIVSNSWSGDYATKVNNNTVYNGEHGIRMSEAYLNRAEAYAHKYEAGDNSALESAISDLNNIRKNRYTTDGYVPLNSSISSTLLKEVLDERQRELVWEDNFRWMDIKRLGLSVEHIFIDEEGNSNTYTLKSGDPLYALPIPNDAISRNPNLEQNPR